MRSGVKDDVVGVEHQQMFVSQLQSFFEGASVANVAASIEMARWAKAESGPGDAEAEEEEGEI